MEQNKVNFSDDEGENEIINDNIEELSDDEMDDEMRAYIYELTINKIREDLPDQISMQKKKKKRKKKKEKKIITLNFNSVCDIPKKENTWKSKRLDNKVTKRKEYKFTPKMIPYEYRHQEKEKEQIKNMLDENDFPSL
tara:strand:+ start:2623 stop:3036 length:414 start_codon:yes stop_codon:yes gene_type:complete